MKIWNLVWLCLTDFFFLRLTYCQLSTTFLTWWQVFVFLIVVFWGRKHGCGYHRLVIASSAVVLPWMAHEVSRVLVLFAFPFMSAGGTAGFQYIFNCIPQSS